MNMVIFRFSNETWRFGVSKITLYHYPQMSSVQKPSWLMIVWGYTVLSNILGILIIYSRIPWIPIGIKGRHGILNTAHFRECLTNTLNGQKNKRNYRRLMINHQIWPPYFETETRMVIGIIFLLCFLAKLLW